MCDPFISGLIGSNATVQWLTVTSGQPAHSFHHHQLEALRSRLSQSTFSARSATEHQS